VVFEVDQALSIRAEGEHAVERACRAISSAKHILLDWDGCLAVGGRLLPGAKHFLERFADRTAILSNNSSFTSRQMSRRLDGLGFSFPADRIQLAGEQALHYVYESYPKAKVLLLASRSMQRAALRLGLQMSSEKADVVLVMRDEKFDYQRLQTAASLVRAGAILVGANRDTSHPGVAGIVPETGALVAAILAASGTQDVMFLGKPSPSAFESAMARIGAEPSTTVMIGDNPDTDGLGATNVGVVNIITHPDSELNLLSITSWLRCLDDRIGERTSKPLLGNYLGSMTQYFN
jgi:4-nitrophenyl phosphatase